MTKLIATMICIVNNIDAICQLRIIYKLLHKNQTYYLLVKIEEKVFKFKLAPPINKPSIFLLSKKTNELCLFTEPPYNMLVFSYDKLIFVIIFLIYKLISSTSFTVGVFPVPIAQIGS